MSCGMYIIDWELVEVLKKKKQFKDNLSEGINALVTLLHAKKGIADNKIYLS